MAKQVQEIQISLKIPYNAGVRDDANIQITQVNYSARDSVDTDMTKSSGLHTEDSIPETVSTAELGLVGTEGTLLYKINAIEGVIKTKESI